MTHRLTRVQKQVLWHMFRSASPVFFETGHKETTFVGNKICCQSLVPYFLKHHGYIYTPNPATTLYELTNKGIVALKIKP